MRKGREVPGGEKGTGREMKGKREWKRSYQYFFSQVQAQNYGHTTYGSD